MFTVYPAARTQKHEMISREPKKAEQGYSHIKEKRIHKTSFITLRH